MAAVDISGKSFGDLTVKSYAGRKVRTALWLCVCVCGTEKIVARDKLVSGKTVSCGCKRYRKTQPAETHGLSKAPEWVAWSGAKGRCFNPKNKRFPYYGGRGITMCDRWRDDFEAFFSDMGARPSSRHSLDRIDTDGNYSPDNCQWSTLDYQKKNRRVCYVGFRGESVILSEIPRDSTVSLVLARARIARGWSAEDAVNVPAGSLTRWNSRAGVRQAQGKACEHPYC